MMVRLKFLLVFLFFSAVATCLLADQAPVSLVCFLNGKAYIEEGSKRQEIALFTWLNAGTKVYTEKDTKLTLVYFSGERFEFSGQVAAMIDKMEPRAMHGSIKRLEPVPAIIKLLPVKKGELKTTKAAAVRLRAAGDDSCAVKGFRPSDQSYVLADATTISFDAIPDVQTYGVVIEDVHGKVVHSAKASEPSVAVPTGLLIPGKTYYWRISSLNDHQCSGQGEASFVTLKKEDADMRSALKLQVAKNPMDLSLLVLLTELDRRFGLATHVCEDVKVLRAKASGNAPLLERLNQYNCPE
jgi:hypothetical protein